MLTKYSLRFKMNVAVAICTQIKEEKEIIIRHKTFTKLPLLYKKKTNLSCIENRVREKFEYLLRVKLEEKN